MDTVRRFWQKIDQTLERQNLSLAALARETGVKYGAIKTWRYNCTIPNPDALIAFSDFLGVSIDYLLRDSPSIVIVPQDRPEICELVSECGKRPELTKAIIALVRCATKDG